MPLTFKELLSKYRFSFLKLTGLGFGQACVNVSMAFVVQQVFDGFLKGGEVDTTQNLFIFAAILVFAAIANGFFFMLERTCSEDLGQKIVHDLRIKMFSHLTKVYPRVLEQKNKGGMHLRLVNDLTAIRQWATLGLSRIIVSGISVILTLCALAYTSIILSALIFFFVLVGVSVSVFLGSFLRFRVKELRKRRAYLANNVGEKIDAMQTIQVFGRERSETKRITKQSTLLVNAALSRARMIGCLRGIIISLTGLATMSVLIVSSYLVTSHQITPGTVAAAMSIVGFLMPPLRDFGRIYEYRISFIVAAEKIEQTLNLEKAKLNGKRRAKSQDIKGNIEYRNVTVDPLFSDFSAKVKAGEKIVITGANGVGKSTLFLLLLGIIEADSGEILIDGNSLKEWNIPSLRSHIGVVSHDLPLIRGTLRKNILYRRQKAKESEMQYAMDLSGLSDKLDQFSEGLDTRIAERGKGFSSGERQKLALTRALLGMPEILLLDEAESNLDEESKEIICRLIKTYPGTIMAISHDPQLINMADTLWEFPPKKADEKVKRREL